MLGKYIGINTYEICNYTFIQILLPKDIDKEYINPIYQGFLTKEGSYVISSMNIRIVFSYNVI